jgi:hypothetical protein
MLTYAMLKVSAADLRPMMTEQYPCTESGIQRHTREALDVMDDTAMDRVTERKIDCSGKSTSTMGLLPIILLLRL